MHIHLNEDKQLKTVTFYDANRIVFDTESFTSSILACKHSVDQWPVMEVADLASRVACQMIIERAPSLLIVGQGQIRSYATDAIFMHIIAANIPYELMILSSAIKTYNSALLEGRNVLGAFILGQKQG